MNGANFDRKERLKDLEARRGEDMNFKWQTAVAQIMRFIANNHGADSFFVLRSGRKEYDTTVFLLVIETLKILKKSGIAVKFVSRPPAAQAPCFLCTTTYDSKYTLERWLRYGCVEEGSGKNRCRPISPWDAEDVLAYIEIKKTQIKEKGTI